jgi:ABC-2 type transport system ATP-binding protein
MRQRLAIAQAMLGLPELLLMDEPTNGLDPPQIHAMREVLRRYAATGRTVLLSSHLLSEVEQTCTHVVVVHLGRTIAAGTVTELVATSGEMVFVVDDQDAAEQVLRTMATDIERTEGGMQADLGQVPAAQAVSALVAAGVAVSSAAPRNRLEDVFLAMVDASGAAGSSTDYPVPGTGPAEDGIGGGGAGDGASPAAGPGVGERTPVSSTRQGGQS